MSGGESYIGKAPWMQSPSQTRMMQNLPSQFSASVYPPMVPPNSSSSPSQTTLGPSSYQTDIGAAGGDGGGSAVAQSIINNIGNNTGEVGKRKRGRPRKYALESSMAPALTSPNRAAARMSSGKKNRGRPPGSGRIKKVAAASGSAGVGFAAHVITVQAGEDVLANLMSFSQHNTQAICILSANGTISNVTLQQVATSSVTVTYEGRFEILSLSGSFLPSESGGQRSRTGGLNVTLAGPDGRVLGGGVAGLLTAASPVQVIVGSFMPAGMQLSKPNHNESFAAPPNHVQGTSVAGSPQSRATQSESSGGLGSPLNHPSNTSNPQATGNIAWRWGDE